MSLIQGLETTVAEHKSGGSPEKCRERVARDIIILINGLRAHFKAEAESLRRDFDDEPRLKDQLRRLDEEHPRILSGFEEVARMMEKRSPLSQICAELDQAISRFRDHEAREDGLFIAD